MRNIYLITGASSDIGMAFLHSAAEKHPDALFYAHYRTMSEEFAALVDQLGPRLVPVQSDLSAPDGAHAVISAVRETPTHFLHLPAGKLAYKRLKEVEVSTIGMQMRIQVYSLLELSKAILPAMAKQKYGKCTVLVSSAVRDCPPKFMTEYVTVKSALLGLTQSLAVEYAPKGVLINTLSPHMVQTKFLQDMDERLLENLANADPLGRHLTPEEVAEGIEFLLSSEIPIWGKNFVI